MAIAWCEVEVRNEVNPRIERGRQALQRLQGKKEIIAELIGGRLALLEATARFRSLSDNERSEEAACREVIGWAHLALCDRPEKADSLSCQLEQELERHLSRHGTAHVPAPGRGHDRHHA
jgi:hypothetical protein